MITVVTWNINGIRAAARNGFAEWLAREQPTMLCLQEIKAAGQDAPDEARTPPGYTTFWRPALRKGYSGVATFVRHGHEPAAVYPMGAEEFDAEGRVQVLEYPEFTLINAYFPKSQTEGPRLQYKLDFCEAILKYCRRLRKQGRNVLLSGDYNIAHKEVDLARPKENENNPGFLPVERAFMDKFTKAGFVDTFRHFCDDPGYYTWWSYRARAREKNVGWRLDCHCVNPEFIERVRACEILIEVKGSDHCPVRVTLDCEGQRE